MNELEYTYSSSLRGLEEAPLVGVSVFVKTWFLIAESTRSKSKSDISVIFRENLFELKVRN